jgi:energy-converting hydrogenase Eha subunit H
MIRPNTLHGTRMIWLLAFVTALALVVAFTTHSPGLVAFGLFIALIGVIALALIFIDRHMRASSRPEHMTKGELEALKATLHKGTLAAAQLPPSEDC